MFNTSVLKDFFCQRLVFLSVFLLFATTCSAAVIFETNFDGYTWNANGVFDGTECDQTTGVACANAPQGFTNYRNQPPGSGPITTPWSSIATLPGSKPDHTTGSTSGHAFIAHYSTANYDGDSMISIMFPVQYKELFVQMWMKTSGLGVVESSNSKMFRALAVIPGCSNFYSYFSGGCSDALAFNDFGAYGSAAPLTSAWTPSLRCGPNTTNYTCSSSPNFSSYDWSTARLGGVTSTQLSTSPGQWNDGAWHKVTMHVKMNDIGSSNGLYDVTYDGNSEIMHDGRPANLTNLAYILSGARVTGWNAISLGGNTTSLTGLGWIAYDDLVISTTAIPSNYVIGGGVAAPAQVQNPKGVKQ